MKQTALVIMAAGIGSRFGGGIKQLEPVGPGGEIIMDYSIHDALEAGFNRIIFVIRRDLEKDFKRVIGERIEKIAPVSYAYQELEDLPQGYTVPEGRQKPWGTGQAVLSIRDMIREPFLVINADDYYGKEVFQKIHDYMANEMDEEASVYDKSEYLLPAIIDKMIRSKRARVTVLGTKDRWFGVTYKEDKESVANSIRDLIRSGVYPERL